MGRQERLERRKAKTLEWVNARLDSPLKELPRGKQHSIEENPVALALGVPLDFMRKPPKGEQPLDWNVWNFLFDFDYEDAYPELVE